MVASRDRHLSTPQKSLHRLFGFSPCHLRALPLVPIRDARASTTPTVVLGLCVQESVETLRQLPCLVPVSDRPGRPGIAARIRQQLRNGSLFVIVRGPALHYCVAAPSPRG